MRSTPDDDDRHARGEGRRGVLVIFVLGIQSSYADNVECPAVGTAHDTVQFLLVAGHAWRIKTFAVDHDVHVWRIGSSMDARQLEALARQNTHDNYGDVIEKVIVVHAGDSLTSLEPRLVEAGLPPYLEIAPNGDFAFWKPDASDYATRSQPQ